MCAPWQIAKCPSADRERCMHRPRPSMPRPAKGSAQRTAPGLAAPPTIPPRSAAPCAGGPPAAWQRGQRAHKLRAGPGDSTVASWRNTAKGDEALSRKPARVPRCDGVTGAGSSFPSPRPAGSIAAVSLDPHAHRLGRHIVSGDAPLLASAAPWHSAPCQASAANPRAPPLPIRRRIVRPLTSPRRCVPAISNLFTALPPDVARPLSAPPVTSPGPARRQCPCVCPWHR